MKYKNVTDHDLVIPNVGTVKAGDTIETDQKIENHHFVLVGAMEPQKEEPTKEQKEEPLQTNSTK